MNFEVARVPTYSPENGSSELLEYKMLLPCAFQLSLMSARTVVHKDNINVIIIQDLCVSFVSQGIS